MDKRINPQGTSRGPKRGDKTNKLKRLAIDCVLRKGRRSAVKEGLLQTEGKRQQKWAQKTKTKTNVKEYIGMRLKKKHKNVPSRIN